MSRSYYIKEPVIYHWYVYRRVLYAHTILQPLHILHTIHIVDILQDYLQVLPAAVS